MRFEGLHNIAILFILVTAAGVEFWSVPSADGARGQIVLSLRSAGCLGVGELLMDRRAWLEIRYARAALIFKYPQVEGGTKGYLVSSSVEQIIPYHGEVGQSEL